MKPIDHTMDLIAIQYYNFPEDLIQEEREFHFQVQDHHHKCSNWTPNPLLSKKNDHSEPVKWKYILRHLPPSFNNWWNNLVRHLKTFSVPSFDEILIAWWRYLTSEIRVLRIWKLVSNIHDASKIVSQHVDILRIWLLRYHVAQDVEFDLAMSLRWDKKSNHLEYPQIHLHMPIASCHCQPPSIVPISKVKHLKLMPKRVKQ